MRWLDHERLIDRIPGQSQRMTGVRQVVGAGWVATWPTPVPRPRIVAGDDALLDRLLIGDGVLHDPGFAQVMGGCALYAGMRPWAHNYGGHQFGHWAGQLGDGRAISLGDLAGKDGSRWEIQLKGAGPTPFSRSGDGRAVLRSSIREFVASQAMAALGIPTTRAPLLLTTGQDVLRDLFYDGHPSYEPGAIVVRAAPSFLRFGSVQLPASRGETMIVAATLALALERHYPHLVGHEDAVALFFGELAEASAELVAHWQRVGFVHAVLNTDNMHLGGLTIDYGPFAWMEAFDPDFTPNTSDAAGRRYRFGAQPAMVRWNLVALAQALAVALPDPQMLSDALARYDRHYRHCRQRDAAAKLGVEEGEAADALFTRWEGLMHHAALDMTLAYRALGQVRAESPSSRLPSLVLADAATDPAQLAAQLPALQAWLLDYQTLLHAEQRDPLERRASMAAVNPWFVPRNWVLQSAIDAALDDDWSVLADVCTASRQPYRENTAFAHWVAPSGPQWQQRRGCNQLSCSS